MNVTNLKHGGTLDLQVAATDGNGDPITLDGTYEVATRFTEDSLGGTLTFEGLLTIAAGVATLSIDTGASPWAVGAYVYDFRITDPAGDDFWSAPILLILSDRNTLPS